MKLTRSKSPSILWVDSTLGISSPTTKPLFLSLQELKKNHFKITFLGNHCDDSQQVSHFYQIFSTHKWGPLAPLINTIQFHLYIFYLIIFLRKRFDIIHSTLGTYFFSNISSMHFWNTAWFKIIIKEKRLYSHLLHHLPFIAIGCIIENLHFTLGRTQRFLPVSRGISHHIPNFISHESIHILCNAFDEVRFNPQIKNKFREIRREQLGYSSEHSVFLFASQGHYERKGFYRAFEALRILRKKHSQIRFLIVGGHEKRIEKLKNEIIKVDPSVLEWITFVGMQERTEEYFSAADAFLFPSYFEAFCLAEIECAALGIPLLLTQHPGVEMILKDGKNGLLLPETPEAMAERIEVDFLNRKEPWSYDVGEALTQADYTKKLVEIYTNILAKKKITANH